MRPLLLQPTPTALWHTLLFEAQHHSKLYINNQEIEAYLVLLLIRFSTDLSIASSVLGLEFLESYQKSTSLQHHYQLREVGDKCLLFSGLFPERAKRHRVKSSYFIKLGQLAYSELSLHPVENSAIFVQLCSEFYKLTNVLQHMRSSAHPSDLLHSLEHWYETGDKPAWQNQLNTKHQAFFYPQNNKKH